MQKVIFEAVSPAGFLFARYLIMPACALALLAYVYGRRFPAVPRADLLALARLGFFGHVLHVGTVTFGIHWSTAFSSSLILACGPVFTLLTLRFSGIERLTRTQLAGATIACIGVVVFLWDKLAAGRWGAGGGDLVLLVSASFFSYYTVASKPLIERHGGVVVMAYATLLGAAPIVVLTAPVGLRVDWSGFGPAIWLGLLFAIVVSAFVGWLVWGWVNAVRGVARTAPMMYGMPPVAGLIAWISVGEAFTATKIAGAAIALGGVALAQFAGGAALPGRGLFRMRLPSVRSAASRR
ncbi:MAG: DMT family transporter [Burkholderiaceae bacterium]|nr:DMT family transporter [Burkholderiaceae bacterium]